MYLKTQLSTTLLLHFEYQIVHQSAIKDWYNFHFLTSKALFADFADFAHLRVRIKSNLGS